MLLPKTTRPFRGQGSPHLSQVIKYEVMTDQELGELQPELSEILAQHRLSGFPQRPDKVRSWDERGLLAGLEAAPQHT